MNNPIQADRRSAGKTKTPPKPDPKGVEQRRCCATPSGLSCSEIALPRTALRLYGIIKSLVLRTIKNEFFKN